MKGYLLSVSAFFLLLSATHVSAQYVGTYGGAWSTTWNNPTSSLASVMIQNYINKKSLEQSIANQKGRSTGSTSSGRSATPSTVTSQPVSTPVNYAVIRFKPVANSGVPKQVADALGRDPQERAELLKIFQQVKRSYEAEAAKEGRSNDLAVALTFFLSAMSMAYHETGEPPESVTNGLVEILQQDMSVSPGFKSMTNLEKQKMHDWLVVAGGFVLAGYSQAVETKDPKQLADYKELAHGLYKLVVGDGIEKVNLAKIK
jgi:hypothetical protein